MSCLRWHAMPLLDIDVPAACVARGEYCRLVMPRPYQQAWLQTMLAGNSGSDLSENGIFFETDNAQVSLSGGDTMFSQHVACLLHARGAIANLSLRENLLLPFLYGANRKSMASAQAALPEVADWLDLSAMLDEQAGERSNYVHALISLGRIMLQQPDILIVQDVHAGMQAHRLERFRLLFGEAVRRLGVGVLYLSSSAQDGMGLNFCRSLELAGAEDVI